MIFSAPRFVVVDDKIEHLNAILRVFQELGSPCQGVHYVQENGVDSSHFRGVRCLFMDLHLVSTQTSSDYKSQYSTIAGILEDVITANGGPYILVLWTEQSHVCDEFRAYLDKNLDKNLPYVRPLAVLSLAKERFISPDTGVIKDVEKLKGAVTDAIVSSPQLAALLGWESDVLRATGDTLAALLSLVPTDARTVEKFSPAIDVLLSRLVQETLGYPHVEQNQRTGITTALAPILIDRILNQEVSEEAIGVWDKAVTKHSARLAAPTAEEAGWINRMLHFAIPGAETVRPTDWGGVVEWPFEWNDEQLAEWTGLSTKQMCCEEFKLRSKSMSACAPVLVRVGAVCDYAQDNRGPITYLFAMEIPASAQRQESALPGSVWQSPVFMSPVSEVPVSLAVNIRFPFTFLKPKCEGFIARYRVREQLLMQLITSASNYASRPGIVRLTL